MLPRNYLELAILAAVFLFGLVVYFVVRHKAAKYESDLNIIKKEKLRGRLD